MKTFKSTLKEINAFYKVEKEIHNVKISSSSVVNELVRKIYPVDITYREAMLVLYLNNSNITVTYSIISVGGLVGTIADVRIILKDALLSKATGMILIHNHPSQCFSSTPIIPSSADKAITKKVKEAGLLMDIKLLDHVIISKLGYYSFADENIL
jgi:DNA repair protein RadC